MDEVWQDPKGTVWQVQTGQEQDKARLARRTVTPIALQVTGGLVLSVVGMKNKMINQQLETPLYLLIAVAVIAGCGLALLAHKHLRV